MEVDLKVKIKGSYQIFLSKMTFECDNIIYCVQYI